VTSAHALTAGRGCAFERSHNGRMTDVVMVGDGAQTSTFDMDHAGCLSLLVGREFRLRAKLNAPLPRCCSAAVGPRQYTITLVLSQGR
jgi:hypothetical protein